MRFLLPLLVLLLHSTWADIYLHNPRGSNNRLNEQGATRTNNNRLFDSQNNNRGGYNVGDKHDKAASGADSTRFETTRQPAAAFNDQDEYPYQMVYFEKSILPVEWTAQHACGGHEGGDPNKANCNIILQYACETDEKAHPKYRDPLMSVPVLHDGLTTTSPDAYTGNDPAQVEAQHLKNNQNSRGRHESEAYYNECYRRQRNKGLFIADNNPGSTARYTRQNPGGGRSGLECPEERDYYPYWMPSPWRDIAYLTDAPELFCTKDGKLNTDKWPSLNNVQFSRCIPNEEYREKEEGFILPSNVNNYVSALTETECKAKNGVWKSDYSWGLPAPECLQVDWSRANHLGNGRDTEPINYNWTLPSIDDLEKTGVKIYDDAQYGKFAKCVLRVRYNISTDDYNPWETFADQNKQTNHIPPVENDPYVDIGAGSQGLQLNLNTQQTGRVFQDRSHVFWIKERPDAWKDKTIYNLNVRGKRGNIVQVYPAVEYDFKPGRLHVGLNDLIHIQWTGSNTHANNGNGGDGDTGADGQGRAATDRHNMVQLAQTPCPQGKDWCGDRGANIPIPLDKFKDNMFSRSKCYDVLKTKTTPAQLGTTWVDCAVTLATSGVYKSAQEAAADARNLNPVLNNGFASLKGGVVMTFGEQYASAEKAPTEGSLQQTTIYDYMCTRNNAFSNRSQKASIVVQVNKN